MEQFTEIIDTYILNYDLYENGKVEFECDYGELIFCKRNKNILTLFGIYIFPEYRKNGFCKNILQYLIDKGRYKFKYILVESVLSKIFYEYLLRFEYKNKKFKKIYEGFLYKN
jgi:hypothetical protein